jgi:hypothetical protein
MACVLHPAPALQRTPQEQTLKLNMAFKPPIRLSLCIGGISICLLLASGVVAIARLIPTSYANVPEAGAPSKQQHAPAQVAIDRHHWATCPQCGVIESMRQSDGSGDSSRQGAIDAKAILGSSGGASGGANAASATGKRYEFTVRFRDGSTAIFTETGPRVWRLGSRVMVIGRSQTPNS